MTGFSSALWAETLKMIRSKVPLFCLIGFSMAPLAGGLFMIILKNPEAARSMGLISTKAHIMAGTADWPAFFNLLAQAVAAGGAILFSILTIWVFGREFSDHTVKELLALPTSREAIVAAKFIVIAVWTLAMTLFIFGLGFDEIFVAAFLDLKFVAGHGGADGFGRRLRQQFNDQPMPGIQAFPLFQKMAKLYQIIQNPCHRAQRDMGGLRYCSEGLAS